MSYLIHHGIRGQKWGKRNGPPYPLSPGDHSKSEKDAGWRESLSRDTSDMYSNRSDLIVNNPDGSRIIKKGFKLNRVGKDYLDVNQSGGLYVSYGENDAKRYVKELGPSLVNKMFGTAGSTIQHISVKEDLRMPSDELFGQECAKALLEDSKFIKKFNESMHSYVYSVYAHNTDSFKDGITKKDLLRIINNPKSKEARVFAYSVNSFFGDPDFKDETKRIYDIFRKLGFDAIQDIHDTMSGTSETAFIVINPSKVFLTSTTSITKERYKEAKQFVRSLEKLKVDETIE